MMQDVVLMLEVKLDMRLICSGNHDESVINKLRDFILNSIPLCYQNGNFDRTVC